MHQLLLQLINSTIRNHGTLQKSSKRAFNRKLLQIILGNMLHATANTSTVLFFMGATCAFLAANNLGMYSIV
jgi:hypothetical protein